MSNNKKFHQHQNSGQQQTGHVIVSILIVMVVATTVMTAIVSLVISNFLNTGLQLQSSQALSTAETGVENAILRIIRDPDYSGETLMIGDSTVAVTVTGDTNKTIRSVGTTSNAQRIIEAQVTYQAGRLELVSWQEIW